MISESHSWNAYNPEVLFLLDSTREMLNDLKTLQKLFPHKRRALIGTVESRTLFNIASDDKPTSLVIRQLTFR